jgi:hypothetical protein
MFGFFLLYLVLSSLHSMFGLLIKIIDARHQESVLTVFDQNQVEPRHGIEPTTQFCVQKIDGASVLNS